MRWPVLLLAILTPLVGAVGQLSRSPDAPVVPDRPPAPVEVRIPMRDGTVLAGDLYQPSGPGRWPVIVEATPYGKRTELSFINEREFWPRHGFAFLSVDVRGQHASGGDFGFLIDGPRDGFDMVEWAAAQSWSNGRVGMRGSSYSGSFPWYAAKANPPHLRCINPNAALADPFDGPPYYNGAFMQQWALDWIGHLIGKDAKPGVKVDYARLLSHHPLSTMDVAAYGAPLPTYRQILAHQTRDVHWRPIVFEPADYARIRIPTLAFSGWYDGTLPGTVRHYRAMKRHSPAARDQWLVVGPWEHTAAADGGWDFVTGQPLRNVGAMRFPDRAFVPAQRRALAFFDWCLRGGTRPDAASLETYIVGADRWVRLANFPAPQPMRSLYLDAGARLVSAPPHEAPPDSYIYDPINPAPSVVTTPRGEGSVTGPEDMAPLLGRGDTVVYTGAALAAPLTILGDVMLELHAASNARDTDFVARLEDLGPDGRAVKLGAGLGIVRARYRHGFARAELLTPGRVERYRIAMGTMGYLFARGHRLRLSITSSAYPLISVNPNTGNDIATDTARPVRTRQMIYHDRRRPSRLLLPVFNQ